MTMTDTCTVVCICCGAENSCEVIRSTNQLGPSDLDLRPGYDFRGTMDCWIHRCVNCASCARSLDAEPRPPRELLESEAYIAQLRSRDYPVLANTFLCSAMILEERGDVAGASADALAAAWVCDDANLDPASHECRRLAARLLEVAIANPESDFGPLSDVESPAADARLGRPGPTLRLVDMLRRVGDFTRAGDVARAWLQASEARDDAWWMLFVQEFPGPQFGAFASRNFEHKVRSFVRYQVDLLGRGDTAAHQTDEPFILADDGSSRIALARRLEMSDPDRLREALLGDDIDACRRRRGLVHQLEQEEREAARVREQAAGVERGVRRNAAAERVMSGAYDTDERMATIRRFWPDASALMNSGAVDDRVLLADSPEGVLEGLVIASRTRCPRCGFTKGRVVGEVHPSCLHCGWKLDR